MHRSTRRGATLIFVLGVLALLSLFAVTFMQVVRLERGATRNYVDGVRANLAARAGVAASIAAVRDAFRAPNPTVCPPALAGGAGFTNPAEKWFYKGHSKSTLATGNGVPLAVAMT